MTTMLAEHVLHVEQIAAWTIVPFVVVLVVVLVLVVTWVLRDSGE